MNKKVNQGALEQFRDIAANMDEDEKAGTIAAFIDNVREAAALDNQRLAKRIACNNDVLSVVQPKRTPTKKRR